MDTKFPDSLADWPRIAEIPHFHPIYSCLYPSFRPLISKVFKPSGEDFRFADLYHLSTLVLASWTVNYRVRSGVVEVHQCRPHPAPELRVGVNQTAAPHIVPRSQARFQPTPQPRQFIDFGDDTPFPPSFRRKPESRRPVPEYLAGAGRYEQPQRPPLPWITSGTSLTPLPPPSTGSGTKGRGGIFQTEPRTDISVDV